MTVDNGRGYCWRTVTVTGNVCFLIPSSERGSAMYRLAAVIATVGIVPAELLNITAEALAENACRCPETANLCRACSEAERLASLAGLVESPDDVMNAIFIGGQNSGADLGDLLPGIVDGILDHGACSYRENAEPCTVCAVGKTLDALHQELLAA